MSFEEIKKEFISLKKEEIKYIDEIVKSSNTKILLEEEKLEFYRNLNNYNIKLNELFKLLRNELVRDKDITRNMLREVIIEFDVDNNFLSLLKVSYKEQKNYLLDDLGINPETFKFQLTGANLIRNCRGYIGISLNKILNGQRLIENTIYVYCGMYDESEDCYGPCFGNPEDYLYGIYDDIYSQYGDTIKIAKKEIDNFEKDKLIVHSKRHVHSSEIKSIFEEELLNTENNSLKDCVIQTRNRVDNLNYVRSPEYKEKVLLDKINLLYSKVKGEFIKSEILYNGDFLKVLKEIYKLPNNDIVKKEKVLKNNGKNAVIIIPITNDKEYIVTFQNRIKDKLLAEFPSGYIEDGEDPIDAAKRELLEETGYITDDLFIIDEAYASLGIDNSITYIVVANSCEKEKDVVVTSSELINYGLFTEKELEYFINNNIINGVMNKLAYYTLINNTDNCNVTYTKSNKKIYKSLKKKRNPLDN